MRTIVTGASGFIGQHVLPILRAKGHDVHAFSRKAPPEDLANHATWHDVDLLDHAATNEAVSEIRPTHLLHFSWIATPGVYQQSPENHDWLAASVHLFETAKEAGATRIVAAGTCFEYDWPESPCIENVTPLAQKTIYGQCKNECRKRLEAMDVSSAWGRIFFVYGPHEAPKRLFSSVLPALIRGETAECTHGRQIRDYEYVENVSAAFVALLLSEVTGPVNIGSGESVTIRELLEQVQRMIGTGSLAFGAKEAPGGEPPMIVASVERLRKEVGFLPTITKEEGLRRTVEWWRKELAANR